MKNDIIKQYVSARDTLLREKAQLEARLAQIHEALDEPPSKVTVGPEPAAPVLRPAGKALSLRAAVVKATTGQPMTKPEILAAIQTLGYRTTSKHPVRLLDNLLYGTNPKFKREDGRFSPLNTTAALAPAKPVTPPAKPAMKRTLSAATRAKMSASAVARWAKKLKAGGKKLKAV